MNLSMKERFVACLHISSTGVSLFSCPEPTELDKDRGERWRATMSRASIDYQYYHTLHLLNRNDIASMADQSSPARFSPIHTFSLRVMNAVDLFHDRWRPGSSLGTNRAVVNRRPRLIDAVQATNKA